MSLAILGSHESQADLDLRHAVSHLRRRASRLTPLKARAMQDYRTSMADFGGYLANRPEQLQHAARDGSVLDVVVVGSGYGGAINAARLSAQMRLGSRLAVLERGREWLPGTFPDTLPLLLRESRYGLFGPARKRIRNQLGLVDLSYHDEVFVLAGSGLGGGSLINAGVAVAPDPDVFCQDCWPTALRDRSVLAPYYDRVAYELNLQAIDCETPKTRALQYVASRVTHVPIVSARALVTATYKGRGLDPKGRNRQGVLQRDCELCGDCTTGCNVGAKNTLPMNYLPVAKHHGAEIYTQTEVNHIEKCGALYRVHFTQHTELQGGTHAFQGAVYARIVILAAGSPGTTGILLRSQQRDLQFSDRLGTQWSGNGDTYGFMVRGDSPAHAAGQGAYEVDDGPVGVTQQRHLYLRDPLLKRRMLIQEGSIPRAYTNALGGLVADLDLDRTLPFFGLGHDGAEGRVTLDQGRPSIEWSELPRSGYARFAHDQLRRLAEAGNGRYRKPESLGDVSMTVHPLGGCPMADTIQTGVTSDLGEIFDGSAPHSSGATHEGLYVADGSLIPTSLAANPFFTIAAVSERVAEGIVQHPRFADLFLAFR